MSSKAPRTLANLLTYRIDPEDIKPGAAGFKQFLMPQMVPSELSVVMGFEYIRLAHLFKAVCETPDS